MSSREHVSVLNSKQTWYISVGTATCWLQRIKTERKFRHKCSVMNDLDEQKLAQTHKLLVGMNTREMKCSFISKIPYQHSRM